MKILILGNSGMCGNMVQRYFAQFPEYEILCASRTQINGVSSLFVDFLGFESFLRLQGMILTERPEVIINCVGVLIAESEANPERAVGVNSYLPHFLARVSSSVGAKLVHISTDCVFDGASGNYSETSLPNEKNMYGRSKALGEITYGGHLTLRTSIIGPDLKENGMGLFNWLIKQRGDVHGYSEVLWTGLTTLELAKQIKRILEEAPNLSGLYHLAPPCISKYSLLALLKEIFSLDEIRILRELNKKSNKALVNTRKREYQPGIPTYRQQLEELRSFMGGQKVH